MTRENRTADVITVDPDTGEVITAVDPETKWLPAERTTTADISGVPQTLQEMIAAYQEPEPEPEQVLRWLVGAEEKEEDDATETQLSIMLRILGAEGIDQILGGQEVLSAQTLLGEVLTVQGVKWKKSTQGDARGVYALITAHRKTTDQNVVVSCGAVNVCAQLFRLKYGDFLPVDIAITKSSKPTAAGFYPLWLEPR